MIRILFITSLLIFCLSEGSIAQNKRAKDLLDSLLHMDRNPPKEELLSCLKRLEALSIEEGDKESLAFSLNGRAMTYYYNGDYILYESTINDYMEFAVDTSELGFQHYSLALNNMATVYRLKGYNKESIQYGLKSIEVENRNGANPNELIGLYTNMSVDYRLLGDYENSLNTAFKALAEVKKSIAKDTIEKGFKFVEPYLNIAHSFIDLKSNEDALKWINNGLKDLGEYKGEKNEKFYELSIDLHLRKSQVNLQIGSLDQVLADLLEVKRLHRKSAFRIYYMLELLGEYNARIENYKESINNYNLALKDAKEVYKDNKLHPALPRIYKRRAESYIILDSIDQAFTDFQEGLRYFDNQLDVNWSSNPIVIVSSSAPTGLELITAKAAYACTLFLETTDTTYLNIAKSTYRSAMNLMDDMQLSYVNERSKYYIVSQAQSIYKKYIDLLIASEAYMPKAEWSEEIYNTIQRNKNSVLIDRIRQKVAVLSSDLPPDIKKKESKFRSDISFYTKLISEIDRSDTTLSNELEINEVNLFKSKEDLAIFNNNLKTEYPEYYELVNIPKQYYSLDQVQERLTSGVSVKEYFETSKGYVIITIDQSDVKVDVLEDESVFDLIDNYIESISKSPRTSGNSLPDISHQSEQLYSKLIGNANELEKISQLYVIPDGLIGRLPFSSLINPTSKNYLLSETSVSYLASIDQLMIEDVSEKESYKVLGISPSFSGLGNVSDLDCCKGAKLSELVYAEEEMAYLESIFEGKFVNGQEATKSSFIEHVQDFPVIHLATHACLSDNDPMLSSVFFSDGSLTNYDLQNLNINPELVVLAACNTAQGEIQKGEGIISLSRGFFEAGVKSLVSSLWSIDDYSTSEIVKGMYSHLKEGKSKSESLRQAKLDYLATADKLRSHPYYWAGLVHIGDNVSFYHQSNLIEWIVLAFFLMVTFVYLLLRKSN